jgi:hypothetical protein
MKMIGMGGLEAAYQTKAGIPTSLRNYAAK